MMYAIKLFLLQRLLKINLGKLDFNRHFNLSFFTTLLVNIYFNIGYNCYFTETKIKSKDNKKIGTDRFIPNRKDSCVNIGLGSEKSYN